MSQLGRPGKVSSNVYTVMLIIGTLVLGALVAVLWIHNLKMTEDESNNPMIFYKIQEYNYKAPDEMAGT